jgi:hypothetical protein
MPEPPPIQSDPVAERKLSELRRKLLALLAEFRHWRAFSMADKAFKKHHTQVRAVISHLRGLTQETVADLAHGARAEEVLKRSRNLEQNILAVRRVWEFFRVKWIQRTEAEFKDYLAIADELAWACYKPVLDCAISDPGHPPRQEPPLVFLNGGGSPFALAREDAFEAELVVGDQIDGATTRDVLDNLPVPVIGVPWFQTGHLPDALVISHEAGHLVLEDFKLRDQVMREVHGAVAGSPNVSAWEAWLNEVFADVFGCVAMGPAFVSALLDFLAVGYSDVETEMVDPREWGKYPPNYVRVRLNIAALEMLDFTTEAGELKDRWKRYQWPGFSAYEGDLNKIAGAIINGKHRGLNGMSLREILAFTQADQRHALEIAGNVLHQDLPKFTMDIRAILAAVRALYDPDPRSFSRYLPLLKECFKVTIKDEVRALEEMPDATEMAQRDLANRERGSAFAARFKQIAGAKSPARVRVA